jgi:5-methylcytosine-specific restriction endonuclease McrA
MWRRLVAMLALAVLSHELRPALRLPVLHRQDYRCCHCQVRFSQRVPSEIHHIDHNSKNNSLRNLMAVCPTCHAAHHRHDMPLNFTRHVWYLEQADAGED